MRYYNRRFALRRVEASPPVETIPAMDLETAKLHLRVDHDNEDELIKSMIFAATEYVESKGRALITQTWEMVMDDVPDDSECAIVIPKGPVQSIDFIKYVDTAGNLQTWSSSEYSISLLEPVRIRPGYSLPWPMVRSQMDAFIIRFTAGYGDDPSAIPERLSSAMKLLIGHLYINREAVTVIQGIVSLDLPLGFQALLDNAILKRFY